MPVVVQVHVMEPAEQDAPVDVGAARVGGPFVDVVGFAVGGGHAAAVPHASAVADGEGDALFRGEQPLFPADVERVPARVDGHGRVPGVADGLLDRGGGQGVPAVLGVAAGDATVLEHRHEPHPGLPRAEHLLGIGERAGPEHIHEQVVLELLVRARVLHQRLRLRGLLAVDEAGSAESGSEPGGDEGLHPRGAFVVEVQAGVFAAVGVGPHPEPACLVSGQEPLFRPSGSSRSRTARAVAARSSTVYSDTAVTSCSAASRHASSAPSGGAPSPRVMASI
ncbi:hypothetical protein [Microbacterium sp. MEC084]|uniref:hypothetical protein n=1 Tax=Microbacterium sp. MEC084 TaxID=1963027 RepID=UPI001E475762|nr:hypothetical protein [Microbacterium sp. MEC084]